MPHNSGLHVVLITPTFLLRSLGCLPVTLASLSFALSCPSGMAPNQKSKAAANANAQLTFVAAGSGSITGRLPKLLGALLVHENETGGIGK